MKYTKVFIVDDEWYPVYFLSKDKTSLGKEVKVSTDTLARWNKVLKEFEILQKELKFRAEG